MYPLFKNESKKNWHLFGLIPNSWWMAPDWPSLGFTQQWSEYKNDCWKWTSLKIFHQETRGVIWRIEGGVTVSWVQPLWRTVWRFLKILEIELPYDPAIPLLGIHTEETRIERDMCTPMFISALFTTARTWKQPRCPSADEWIRKLWYIYTVEYYSAIKKNAFESVLKHDIWGEPKTKAVV